MYSLGDIDVNLPGRKNEEITSASFHRFLGLFGSSKSTKQGRRSLRKTQKKHKVITEGNYFVTSALKFCSPSENESTMLNSIRMRLEII